MLLLLLLLLVSLLLSLLLLLLWLSYSTVTQQQLLHQSHQDRMGCGGRGFGADPAGSSWPLPPRANIAPSGGLSLIHI